MGDELSGRHLQMRLNLLRVLRTMQCTPDQIQDQSCLVSPRNHQATYPG
jgi:hypothetical protein